MVAHRDLKPENLLLDSKHNIKIADFGLGNVMHDGHFLKTYCGSPNYAAPELLAHRLYAGPEADIWSCGVILYALLCGRLPFDDDNLSALYSRIRNGVYPVSSHMSSSASDLIARILVVDPVRRITIPEICQHPWFQQQLPQYISSPAINTLYDTGKVNEGVVREVVGMGFNVHEVIGSLLNNLQNQATVTYYLLLHQHFRAQFSPCNDGLLVSSEDTDHKEIYVRSVAPVQEKWTLGFKSQASPHQTMTDVLKVFHSLNVRWKQIGHYNMKCLWERPRSKYSRGIFVNGCSQTIPNGGKILPRSTSGTGVTIRTHDSIKFEFQLYKASGEMYVVDFQWLNGPPFLFLELCASFLSVVGIV